MVRSRPPDNELALKINNVVLPRVAATKFLGIIIDDKVSWKPHIQSVKSKLSSVLSIMYKASKLINTAGMYTLYCSLFHPYLSYSNEIWGNTYTSNVKCLFTLQKKAIRQICNADRLAHTNAMFKDMSILKLSEFVKYKTAIVMFNIFHGTLPIQLQRRFCKYSSVYCITPIFRVEEMFAIFANLDFARNFPPAKIISTANGISRNFPPHESQILIAV